MTSRSIARRERVDLRGSRSLGLVGIGRLDGCLISLEQADQLALSLAVAVGLTIEREEGS